MSKTVAIPPLPYAYNALEPSIDEETMHLHHDKHFQSYADKYNAILEANSTIADKSLNELLSDVAAIPGSVRQQVINQGGGVYNHTFFFAGLTPHKSEPTGTLKEAIIRDFGSIETFKSEFAEAAALTFGSGWAWLVKGLEDKLSIVTTFNQDTPISQGLLPILTIDVWEHAYYLKYKNVRPEFIKAFWNVVNWERAEQLFKGEVPACEL